MWNLAKEGGWEQYNKISEEYSKVLEKVVESKDTNIEEKMKKFDKIHNKIKYKAFGKVTISGNRKKKSEQSEDDEICMSKLCLCIIFN